MVFSPRFLPRVLLFSVVLGSLATEAGRAAAYLPEDFEVAAPRGSTAYDLGESNVAAAESFLHAGPSWFVDFLNTEHFTFFGRTAFRRTASPIWIGTDSAVTGGPGVEDPAAAARYTPFDLSLVTGITGGIAFDTSKVVGTTAAASSGIFKGYVVVDTGGGNVFYNLSGGVGTNFNGLALVPNGSPAGTSFDAASGTLVLNGFELNTFKNSGSNVTGAFGDYRLYKSGATPPAFTEASVPFNSDLGGGDQKWLSTGQNTNILAGPLDANSTYKIEVYEKASSTDGDLFLSNGGSNYTATFTVAVSNFTYSGASGGTTNSGVGWTNGRQPGNGHNLTFASSGTTALTNGLATANSLSFSGTAGAFTISGGTIGLSSGISDQSAATQTIGSGLTLNADQSFDVISNGSLVVTGTIAGSGALTKTGGGTLTLQTGANSYSGGTTIAAGTLTFNQTTSLGSGAVTIGTSGGGSAALLTSNSTASPANNIIITSGATGTLTLGSLSTAGSGGSTYSGTVTLNGPLNLTSSYGSGGALKLSGSITGGGALTKVGVGEADLTGTTANTNTGLITVSQGTLGLGKTASVNAFGGDLTISGGTVVYSSTTDNQISDAAKVTISSGTLDFGSRNETIGQTSTATSGLSMSGGSITVGGGTAQFANSLIVTGGSISIGTGKFQANTEFNLSGGTIDLTATGALNLRAGTGTGITYSSSGTTGAQIANSGGNGSVSLNNAAGAVTVFNIADAAGVATELTIAAPLTGGASGGVQKTGTGVLSLTGANTYSGPTAINGGTLLVGNSTGSATSSGAVTVSNSGTLGGTGFINSGSNTITINGKLSPGAAASTGSFGTINLASASTSAGALTLSSTSTLMFDITNTTTKDLVALTSTKLTLGGGTLALNLPNTTSTGIDYTQTYTLFSGVSALTGSFGTVTGYDTTDYMAQFSLVSGNYNLSFTPVPEPGTWVVAGLAATLVGYQGIRRRKRRAARVG